MSTSINLKLLSYEELISLNREINKELNILELNTKNKFKKGDKVYFINKHGIAVYGIVSKINQKTIGLIVKQPNGAQIKWRVSPSLLNFKEE